jgi:hypothetical protein
VALAGARRAVLEAGAYTIYRLIPETIDSSLYLQITRYSVVLPSQTIESDAGVYTTCSCRPACLQSTSTARRHRACCVCRQSATTAGTQVLDVRRVHLAGADELLGVVGEDDHGRRRPGRLTGNPVLLVDERLVIQKGRVRLGVRDCCSVRSRRGGVAGLTGSVGGSVAAASGAVAPIGTPPEASAWDAAGSAGPVWNAAKPAMAVCTAAAMMAAMPSADFPGAACMDFVTASDRRQKQSLDRPQPQSAKCGQ